MLGVACVVMLSGCQAPVSTSAGRGAEVPPGEVEPIYDPETGALQQLQYRPAGSAEGESWAFMDGTRVMRIEVDEDGDGQVDRWEYYGPQQQTGAESADLAAILRAALERVDISTRRDGVVSRMEYYEGGMLVRAEEDTTGSGQVDKWETYNEGFLESLALDSTGRGQPDQRFVYDGGEITRVEVDPDGTGSFRPLTDLSQ